VREEKLRKVILIDEKASRRTYFFNTHARFQQLGENRGFDMTAGSIV
jgi:hypothetical protein